MISRRLQRIKVIQALFAHLSSQSETAGASQKSLNHSITKSYELYYLMLTLPCAVASYSNSNSIGKPQSSTPEINSSDKFATNPVVKQLGESKAIAEFLKKRSLGWSNSNKLIKSLYASLIEKDYYKEYLLKDDCNYNDHKNFIIDFYKNEIEESDSLHDEIEDMSIYWSIDTEYAASHAIKTIAGVSAAAVVGEGEYKEMKLFPIYSDSEDQFFAKDLFIKTINSMNDTLELADKHIHNWDVERIALMDRIILMCAITEIKEFSDIPTKVTMDEYIEISKYYSTVKSSNFINGVLDKLISILEQE